MSENLPTVPTESLLALDAPVCPASVGKKQKGGCGLNEEGSMTITEEQSEAMLKAAKPLMHWLANNTNPHCKVIVQAAYIELVEGLATNGTLAFVDDGMPGLSRE